MKSVLISIQPKWVEKICSGEKTIEVRKSRPKIDTPFKCYIYCTKGENLWLTQNGVKSKTELAGYLLNGKVIGEFICNLVDEYPYDYCDGVDIDDDTILETAIGREAINIYAKGKTLYGWHISDLRIYDKPKELSDFKLGCKGCKERDTYHCKFYCYGERPLTRPPQSWQYVEELTND